MNILAVLLEADRKHFVVAFTDGEVINFLRKPSYFTPEQQQKIQKCHENHQEALTKKLTC